MGKWEKGKVIGKYRGVNSPISFYQLERETGRAHHSLKKWHDLYKEYPNSWGEMYSQALDKTDFEYTTLVHDKTLSNKFKLSRRRPNLSYSHHAEVASLEPDEQDELLNKAEKEKRNVKKN